MISPIFPLFPSTLVPFLLIRNHMANPSRKCYTIALDKEQNNYHVCETDIIVHRDPGVHAVIY